MGQGQPLVSISNHAFKIATANLAPFNRDSLHTNDLCIFKTWSLPAIFDFLSKRNKSTLRLAVCVAWIARTFSLLETGRGMLKIEFFHRFEKVLLRPLLWLNTHACAWGHITTLCPCVWNVLWVWFHAVGKELKKFLTLNIFMAQM